MKKVFLLIVLIISCLIPKTFGKEVNQNINLNSNYLAQYIKENKLDNITGFCTYDFCDNIRSVNILKAVEIFKKKYQEYLMTITDEETALSTIIKGFPITKIKTLNE